ncbi:MAG: hypothetical protein WDA16_10515 [Candidatus Thermoplasmatota archaeon]
MPQIREVLVELNPWWKKPFVAEYQAREIYDEIRKYLKMRHIVALTGLRRVGKTTLVKKIAADAMRDGLDPQNVLSTRRRSRGHWTPTCGRSGSRNSLT